MSVGFLTCATCKNVRQNLIPLATAYWQLLSCQWRLGWKDYSSSCSCWTCLLSEECSVPSQSWDSWVVKLMLCGLLSLTLAEKKKARKEVAFHWADKLSRSCIRLNDQRSTCSCRETLLLLNCFTPHLHAYACLYICGLRLSAD